MFLQLKWAILLLVVAAGFMTKGDEISLNSTTMNAQRATTETDGDTPPRLAQPEPRIVGGRPADPGEYPNFVRWLGCGASLVAPRVILTAAHCYDSPSNEVIVGSSKVGVYDDGTDVRFIHRRLRHPDYDDYTHFYDFMLMQLDTDVDTEKFAPIVLNVDPNHPSEGDILTVIGFGSDTINNVHHVNLMETELRTGSDLNCSSQLSPKYDPDINLCAGAIVEGNDSCQGDSGGPIMDANGVQVGVTSWGKGGTCGSTEIPGVYARTSGVIGWLRDSICRMSNSNSRPDFCQTGEGRVKIRVDITYDRYPRETEWQILTSEGDEIAMWPTGSLFHDGPASDEFYVLPGAYQFTITDFDGICCIHGFGSIGIYAEYEGEELLLASSNGIFRGTQRLFFYPPIGTEGRVKIRLDITNDRFPKETGWTVQTDTGDEIAACPVGSFLEEGLVSNELYVLPGSYEFTIVDSVADGICCGYGDGSIEIYAVVGGMDVLLASSNGVFGGSQTLNFEVTSQGGGSGTSGGGGNELEDDPEFRFRVRRASRGCAWLSRKPRRQIERFCRRKRLVRRNCARTCA